MSKSPKQLARLALVLLTLAKGKLSLGATIALCLAALLYVAVIQPMAESRFGVALPTLPGIESEAPAPRDAEPTRDRSPSHSADKAPSIRPEDLKGLLTDRGRGVFESPSGLRYTRGSQQGHRLAHVMTHARDEPDRVGQHGVFDDGDPAAVIRLIDEAYEQALSGHKTRTERDGERKIYTVDLGRRIGYVGGQSGNRRGRPSANYLKLVLIEDRLITAFPLRP